MESSSPKDAPSRFLFRSSPLRLASCAKDRAPPAPKSAAAYH
eukprot:CAMPEP_0176132814 /NCGR_PEP_ID=MMETSP0120_2-20121206/67295_1 /TAXON_ID=160619 /ORGANISM="Kryptoperidinium foliaceum, Strain CCMP 1326" /LENGTH=41 /DNA_ID= /DNA_START= /DNA_END= /DNA_ORIENTATION=